MGDVALKRLQIGLEGQYTAGAASVYNGGSAIAATRRLALEKAVEASWDFVFEAPTEARGTYAGLYQHILHQISAKGKIPALIYIDDLVWYGRMLISGTPTVTTLPSAPQALLAATAIAASMSLTTQPNATTDTALGKILAITLANAAPSTTAVNITVTGTAVGGAALTEVVAFSAGTTTPSAVGGGAGALTVTLYTKNYFATVNANGITTSAQPASDTVAVAGVNAFQWVFTSDMGTSTLYSATGEYFDGTGSWQLPGIVMNKGTFTAEIGKSFKWESEFMAKNKLALVATANSINPAAATGTLNALTNLNDNILPAIPTYAAKFYSDPIGAVPGTTLVNGRLNNLKIEFDVKAALGKTADGTPNPSFVARSFYGEALKANATLLYNVATPGAEDPFDLNQYLAGSSRTIAAAFPGAKLPTGVLNAAGGWPTQLQDANSKGGYYGLILAISGKYVKAAEKPISERQALEFEMGAEVDLTTMLAPFQMTCISRINPNLL